jgi:hypothetical protein
VDMASSGTFTAGLNVGTSEGDVNGCDRGRRTLAPRLKATLGCRPALSPHAPRAIAFAALVIAAFALAGCTPAIGDRCTLSTDCSVQGNRQCDTTQPGGYCTMLQCIANSCPDNAACVELGASVPGCAYDDYSAPSRVGTSMCLKTCSSDTDCRQSDGYTCGNPAPKPGSAVVLDTNQARHVCLIAGPSATFADAQVCSSSRPDVPPLDASASTVTSDDGGPGEANAGDAAIGDARDQDGSAGDETADAGEEGADASLADAAMEADGDSLADVAVDATVDAFADSASTDAGPGQ